jgi:hypothetical protein
VLNAVIPPCVAALRLPFTVGLGFVVVLLVDALILLLASAIDSRSITVSSFGAALPAALVVSALVVLLQAIFGINDDDTYQLRIINRIARRQHARVTTDVPGIVFLEIDGLALPVLQRTMRNGETPHMARWLESDGYELDARETDLAPRQEPARRASCSVRTRTCRRQPVGKRALSLDPAVCLVHRRHRTRCSRRTRTVTPRCRQHDQRFESGRGFVTGVAIAREAPSRW